MAVVKLKSPRYPVIGLAEAIARVRKVYESDHLNTIPKSVVAEHMGYTSLNGASLGIISAVSKYGLLEGRAEGMRVSDRALAILVHDAGDRARVEAIEEAAKSPALFEELFGEFPNGASDNAIKSFLLGRKKFLPSAAAIAIRAFKETLALVQQEQSAYPSEVDIDEGTDQMEVQPSPKPPEPTQPNPAASQQSATIVASNGPGLNLVRTDAGYVVYLSGAVLTKGHVEEVVTLLTALKASMPDSAPSADAPTEH